MNSQVKSEGQKAQKLISVNVKLNLKVKYYQSKIILFREKIQSNEIKIDELLVKEKHNRKFKVD